MNSPVSTHGVPFQVPRSALEAGSRPSGRFHGFVQTGLTLKTEITLVILMFFAQGLFVWMLYDARIRAQRHFEQTGAVVLESVSANILLNIQHIQRSLDAVAENSEIPGVWDATPRMRNAALFDSYQETTGIIGVLYVDVAGLLRANSGGNLATQYFGDRDYFKFHQSSPGVGPHFTGPIVSRRDHGEAVMVVSRRINNEDGSFNGVVASGVRLSHYVGLFDRLSGRNAASVGMFTDKGILLVRVPFEQRLVGMDLSKGMLFTHVRDLSSGTYIGRSGIDGINRLVVFKTLHEYPLVLTYAVNADIVLAAWKHLTISVSAIALILMCAKGGLLWRLLRARARQQIAERLATKSVAMLSLANATLEDRVSEEVIKREDAYNKLAMGQRLDAIGQLAGGIAHDINGVLQTVSAACTLLQSRSEQSAEVERLSSMALAATGRGSAITHRLLAFARRDQLHAEPVDTTAILVEMRELLTHTLGGHHCRKTRTGRGFAQAVC